MKKLKCFVCGMRFVPRKENAYQAMTETTSSIHSLPIRQTVVYDVIDCPQCGCQKKLSTRIPRTMQTKQEEEQSV